jgi:hypothetical protein
MTRDEQITAALAELAPPRARRDQCRRSIALVLDWVDRQCKAVNINKFFVSKRGKAQIRRYRDAWMEVQAAYDAFDPSIVRWFSLAEVASIEGIPTVVDREIEKADHLIKPSPRPKRDAVRAKAAVRAAYSLLVKWGHQPAVTRGGKWEKLSQILAGGPIYVFEHMRTYRAYLADQRAADRTRA